MFSASLFPNVNSNQTLLTFLIETPTTPRPVFRMLYKFSFHRILAAGAETLSSSRCTPKGTLADTLHVEQASVSKTERRSDKSVMIPSMLERGRVVYVGSRSSCKRSLSGTWTELFGRNCDDLAIAQDIERQAFPRLFFDKLFDSGLERHQSTLLHRQVKPVGRWFDHVAP
jgi:hypothetical protein